MGAMAYLTSLTSVGMHTVSRTPGTTTTSKNNTKNI